MPKLMTSKIWRFLEAMPAVIAGGLALCAALVWALGSFQLSVGPIEISMMNPLRIASQGLAVFLAREAFADSVTLRSRLRFVGLLAALLLGLTAGSVPRVVGDGPEYIGMAWNLARGEPPSMTSQQLREVEEVLPYRAGGYGLEDPDLKATDGRQDFYHSWAYSLVAAPFVRLALWIGCPVPPAFTVLNCLLVLLAAFLVLPRLGPAATLMILGGPILWWVDKAHGEVFTVALSLVAIALLPTRPGLSLASQGLVGLQNPTLGVGFLSGSLWLLGRRRLGEAGVLVGLGIGLALLLVSPAYYLWRIGDPSPLMWTVLRHWPSWQELTAVLFDANLGLLFASPPLFAAVLLALVVGLRTRALSGNLDTALLLAGTFVALLFALTQPANLNHGATRGVSRYALWLMPLAVPLLVLLHRSGRRSRFALASLAALSLILTLGDYQPFMSERSVKPTPIAQWLWRRWPAATNPLPEVFAERSAGFEGSGIVPAATPACEKALLLGDGTTKGLWPLWCRPVDVPDVCSVVGAFCYANKLPHGRAFALAPRQPAFAEQRKLAWAWTGSPRDATVRLLAELPWPELRYADPRLTGLLFAARRGLGRVQARHSSDTLLVWIDRPREGAFLTLLPGQKRRAILIDVQEGTVLRDVAVNPGSSTTIAIPWISPLLLVVVPANRVPPDLTSEP